MSLSRKLAAVLGFTTMAAVGAGAARKSARFLLKGADRLCSITVDGEEAAELHPNEELRLDVIPGEHVVEVATENGFYRWGGTFRVDKGEMKALRVELRPEWKALLPAACAGRATCRMKRSEGYWTADGNVSDEVVPAGESLRVLESEPYTFDAIQGKSPAGGPGALYVKIQYRDRVGFLPFVDLQMVPSRETW